MFKKKLIYLGVIILLLIIFIGASFIDKKSPQNTNETNQIISLILSQPTQGLETESISECFQDTKRYYYVSPECCDGLNPIYDDKGDYLCALGGFTGRGDETCPNSLNLTNCTKIWKDE